MVKIDLITGFLGSGKTTFIKKYAKYLIDNGVNIGILENDYGAVNVDMMLLKDLEGENCELEMIAGGCDAECHRRRFRTKLIAMGMCGYDRVIVEPSGIYDVDEFFDVLRDDPIDRWYEIGNVITVVDAKLELELSDEADYLLASEAANAGCIVLSRSQEAEDEEIENTVAHLNHAMEKVQCKRRFQNEIIIKDWETFDNTDYEKLLSCGYVSENYRKMHIEEGETFKSLYFMNLDKTKDEITEAAKKGPGDGECGKVFRVKGFLKDKEEKLAGIKRNASGDKDCSDSGRTRGCDRNRRRDE